MNVDFKMLRTLCDIAELAGVAIMEVYEQGGKTWEKEDRSPLTEADLRSDKIIRQSLKKAFPGVFILSEESTSHSSNKSDDPFFLVDPLDGTKEFLKRNGEFTVNIALIRHGRPIAGVVYAPALKQMYYAADGLGAWKREGMQTPRKIFASHYQDEQPLRILGSRSHCGDALTSWLAQHPNHTLIAVGSSLKFCYIADGCADIYPRLGPTMQWDTAAGQCIVEQSGGSVVNTERKVLTYGLRQPLTNDNFFAVADLRLVNLFDTAYHSRT